MPFVTKPLNIFHDGIDVFHVFFNRIGIVETEIADAVVAFCYTEVQTDGFCMSYMQITVRFRWKTGLYASIVFSLGQVFFDHSFNKVQTFLALFYVVAVDIAHI